MKVVRLSSGRIRFLEKGDKNNPAFFFIHGWGVSPFTYKASIEALSKDFYVIAPYMQGRVDLQEASEALSELVKQLEISSAVVLGHSFSAIIATAFSYYCPQKVKALVLVDPMGIPIKRSTIGWVIVWLKHVALMFVGSQKQSGKFLLRVGLDFTFHIIFYPHILLKELTMMLKSDISEMLEKLSIPILVLVGKDDILLPKEAGDKIIKLNPKAVLKIMPGGHSWSKVDVKALTREVREFVKHL